MRDELVYVCQQGNLRSSLLRGDISNNPPRPGRGLEACSEYIRPQYSLVSEHDAENFSRTKTPRQICLTNSMIALMIPLSPPWHWE